MLNTAPAFCMVKYSIDLFYASTIAHEKENHVELNINANNTVSETPNRLFSHRDLDLFAF